MQMLFSPAILLMNRLRYRKKFMLLGAVAGAVMVFLLVSVFNLLNSVITAAENELDGIAMLKPVNRLVQSMQQHRGLSAGFLGGNEAMREQRAAKEKEVSAALAAVDRALSTELRDSAEWRGIRADWEGISRDGLKWNPADSLRHHNELIDRILLFMVAIADSTELILDPMLDTYYLMDTIVLKMPAMLESLGQTRGRGTGILAKKEISPAMKVELGATLADLAGTLRAQNINLDKVTRRTPALQTVLSAATREFSLEVDKLVGLAREDILGERFQTGAQDYFNLATALIDRGYKTTDGVLIPALEGQLHERIGEARQKLALNAGLALLAALLLAYLMAGAYFSVVNSVDTLAQGAQRMASGDLTARFDLAGEDELQTAAGHFNRMAETLRHLLGSIQSGVRELHSAAGQLADTSQQISASTGNQSDSASSMAASIEQMTVGVDHIARNAEEAQKFSRRSDHVATEGGQMMRGVVEEIQRIAETVNQSAAVVEELGRQSDQISTIVGTIKDIADQTNLLALNAAIEAARAGESGRGFAVVADEVRKLAERTAKSTQEIAGMISSIQSGTATAVDSMKQGVVRVASGVDQARAAGSVIHQVQEHSQHVVGAVGEISGALREQAAASTEIARNVERIAQMAEENNAAAANNASTAGELRRLAERLAVEVGRFRT